MMMEKKGNSLYSGMVTERERGREESNSSLPSSCRPNKQVNNR